MMKVIRSTQKKYYFELNGFILLDNHFHLLIKTLPGQANISKIMHRIKFMFAKMYNKHTGRTGPFWNERFKSEIVEHVKDAANYLLYLLLKIGYNSFRKGKVRDPRDEEYSSFNCYLNESYKCKLKITLHSVFISLGNSFQERVKKFLSFEKSYREELAFSYPL